MQYGLILRRVMMFSRFSSVVLFWLVTIFWDHWYPLFRTSDNLPMRLKPMWIHHHLHFSCLHLMIPRFIPDWAGVWSGYLSHTKQECCHWAILVRLSSNFNKLKILGILMHKHCGTAQLCRQQGLHVCHCEQKVDFWNQFRQFGI